MKLLSRILVFHVVAFLVLAVASCGSSQRAFTKAQPLMPFDAVIVPGVPFDTAWSDVMRMRVAWSHYLYSHGYTKNVIYSGSAVYSPYVESRIMASYAKELGIPEEHIFTEEQAEHSTENVFYSYYMAQDLGFKNVALATDPFQTKMVKSFAKRKQLNIAYIPAMFDTIHAYYDNLNISIDPTWAEVENFVSLLEREGFWKRFSGTLGKNLKYTPDQITDASMKYRITER